VRGRGEWRCERRLTRGWRIGSENLYIVKTLKEFQYIDEFGKDQGANGKSHVWTHGPRYKTIAYRHHDPPPPSSVRQKAKDITNLLLDEKRMRDQRKNREHMRDRMQGDAPRPQGRPRAHTTGATGRDSDMEAAIAASKRSAEEEAGQGRRTQGEDDLEKALRLSREEDERRRRELAAQNGGSLFDDQQSVESACARWFSSYDANSRQRGFAGAT